MPRISTDNYDTVASWNGSQDLFVVEQPDGTKVATPAMVKQYVLGNSIDDIYSVMGQNGAKNLIPYPYVNTSQTINNVEFTVNGDGSISADNAASAITQFRLCGWTTGLSPLLLRKGTYILSGCPSGGGVKSLRLYLHNQDSSITIADDGEGTQFTLSDDTYVGIAIRVANGYDADGKTVYPMLRLASDTDNTYQPYAKTNRQLTEVIGDLSQTGLTGDSVAEQLDTAREQISDKVQCGVYTSPVKTVQSKQHDAITFSANFPSTVFAAAIMNTINAAYVFANVIKITPTEVQVGVYNDYTNALSGAFTIIYFYK